MELDKYIKNNRLSIIVKPNSPKSEIIGYDESRQSLKVAIKEKCEDNKANIEVMKFFSRLTKKNVKIVSGMTSKRKVIEIQE
ncbi:MAG: DUF167 domain-containing protein [archaeon]